LASIVSTTVKIDANLLAEAQKVSGEPTTKQTVELALRLMIKLRAQQNVEEAFGKHPWKDNLVRPRRPYSRTRQ